MARKPLNTPSPIEPDAVPVITGGTILWFVAFGVLMLLRDRLEAHHAGWWLWVCLAGGLLGLLGTWVARRRRAALRQAALRRGGR